MEITYYGHSAFRLKGKNGMVMMDPYQNSVGLQLPNLSADIVTISHDHSDHNAAKAISGTSRRPTPFIITKPGAYEVGGTSVFGYKTFHDDTQGAERGENVIFTVLIDELRVCHLGDLGHELTSEQVADIGSIDVLFCPVGGHFTINARQAVAMIAALDPAIIIPMHYNTPAHNQDIFADVDPLSVFLQEYGMEVSPQPKLTLEKNTLPEENELVVLAPSVV